jgi:hypothetical protein
LVDAAGEIASDVDASIARGCTQADHLTKYIDQASSSIDEYLSYVGQLVSFFIYFPFTISRESPEDDRQHPRSHEDLRNRKEE